MAESQKPPAKKAAKATPRKTSTRAKKTEPMNDEDAEEILSQISGSGKKTTRKSAPKETIDEDELLKQLQLRVAAAEENEELEGYEQEQDNELDDLFKWATWRTFCKIIFFSFN